MARDMWCRVSDGRAVDGALPLRCVDPNLVHQATVSSQRPPHRDTLIGEVGAWMHDRNVEQSTIDWRFTTTDSRIKLKRLYPAILP